MSDPDRYEALMLEHLYGLLEPAEARELEAYLATPQGSSLRAQAQTWQDQLAGAARLSFESVRFIPPVINPARGTDRGPARAARFTMQSVWARWVVTAAVLVVLVGFGGSAAYQFAGWYAHSLETDQLRVALNDSREALRKLDSQHHARREAVVKEEHDAAAAYQTGLKSYRDALANARKGIEEKDFTVRLTGPDRIQPGAPNSWTIETLDRQGRNTLPRKMDLVVRNEKNDQLLRQTHDHLIRPATLDIPASFWEKVKPGSDLFLEVVAYADDQRTGPLAERLPLARPVYVTHLVTDKPLYRAGEVIRYRSLTLDRATLLPPAHDQHLRFQLKNSDGAVIPLDDANGRVLDGNHPVAGPDGKPLRGIGVGEYQLDDDAPPGEYTLEVAEIAPDGRETLVGTRKFLVDTYTVDVFEKKLEFDGKSYGPGDLVQARIEVSRTAGRPLKDPRADIIASADGRSFFAEKDVRLQPVPNPKNGRPQSALYNVRFGLPADLFARGKPQGKPSSAILSVTIRDGRESEVIARPIPLVEKDLLVEFFPEGGDLVEGVQGRVYFHVRTPSGRPADLKGVITDGTNVVANVATQTDTEHAGVNRGQGVFTFTPTAGSKYFLKLKSPAGITEPTKDGYPLPAARADGVVLSALDAVTEKGRPIRVSVQVGKGPKMLHVGAYTRGRLISHRRVDVDAGKPVEVNLQGEESLGGVTRITVFEEPKADPGKRADLVPRAERLVYRKPGEQLVLTAQPNKDSYAPSDRVVLDLAAVTEKGQPSPAVLLVAVVNQSVITMADNTADRLLPTHFLLAGEVKNPADLEHADFLLTDHPKAAAGLDLLLGTQGWRRFAEQNVPPANPAEREAVERMLVAHGQRTSAPFERYRIEEQRVQAEFLPDLEQVGMRLADARRAETEFQTREEPEFRGRELAVQGQVKDFEKQHMAAGAKLYEFETRGENMRSWALPVFLIALLALAVGGIAFAVKRQPRDGRRPYLVVAAGALVLACLSMFAIAKTAGTYEAEVAFLAAKQYSNTSLGGGRVIQGPQQFKPATPAPPMPSPKEKDAVPVRGHAPKVGPKDDQPRAVNFRPRVKSDDKGLRRRATDVANGEEQQADSDPRREVRHFPGLIEIPPSMVREYAHFRAPSLAADRSDLAETVYWHPVLVLPGTGRTRVEFQLSDDTASYRVLIAGHTVDGRIGAVTKTIDAGKSPAVGP